MEVVCLFQWPAGAIVPLCSYFVPLPFSSQHIVDLFPFEGQNFYFRIKVPLAAIGLSGSNSDDFVWLDLSPDIDRLVSWDSILASLAGRPVEVKVSTADGSIDIDVDGFDVEEFEGHFRESLLYLPSARPSRTEHIPTPPVPKSQEPKSAYRPESASRASTSASDGPPVINLKTVQKGATNLWKALKATTEKLQGTGLGMFAGESQSSMPKAAFQNLQALSQLLSTSYDDKKPDHGMVILKLWEVTFPNDPFPDKTGELLGESTAWKVAGWQKSHPCFDLKVSGLLALQSMVYFGDAHKEVSQQMIQANRANSKQNYPYSIVGVNLTLLLAELFSLRDQEFANKSAAYWELFEDPDAFYEVFSLCFKHIDALWVQKQAVRTQFGAIIGETKSTLARILTRQPTSLEQFRLIGVEEGLLGR